MVSDILNEREKAFENKFRLEEELRFKAHARAAQLFGLWAAERLGISGKDATAYAEKLMELDVSDPDISELINRVHKDMLAKGVDVSERTLYNQFSAKLEQARRKQFN